MSKPEPLSLEEVHEINVDALSFSRPLGSSWVQRLCATVEHYANHPTEVKLRLMEEEIASFKARLDTPLARLESFRALQPGWDSFQAEPLTEDAVQLASLLLGVPEISPTVAGGVLLEWRQQRPGGLYVEIEVLPDGMLEVLLMRGDEPAQEWSRDALQPIREAADNWHALMSEAAEHLKDPDAAAMLDRAERAVQEDDEERRLLREVERAHLAYWAPAEGSSTAGRIVQRTAMEDAWMHLADFRRRQVTGS